MILCSSSFLWFGITIGCFCSKILPIVSEISEKMSVSVNSPIERNSPQTCSDEFFDGFVKTDDRIFFAGRMVGGRMSGSQLKIVTQTVALSC